LIGSTADIKTKGSTADMRRSERVSESVSLVGWFQTNSKKLFERVSKIVNEVLRILTKI